MNDSTTSQGATDQMSPAAQIRSVLTAYLQPGLTHRHRSSAIEAAIDAIPGDASSDYAGIYGALHALAPALDALHTHDDVRTAIISRSDRYREPGRRLLALHGQKVTHWPVVRIDMDAVGAGIRGGVPRLMLRPLKQYGVIRIDALTTLCNVPPEIWRYAIGEDAIMDLEFAAWRAKSDASGPDVSVDKEMFTGRIAWLCRISVETLRAVKLATR